MAQRDVTLKDEEMLRIGCDVHRWMTAWVGIVSHPYFRRQRRQRDVHNRE
jgi:hypothetical protein